jgi:phytoene dehydrogenase-like protein
VATGLPVARIEPGRGVQLDAGDWLHAPVVVSNADPRVALRLLGDHAEPSWRRRVESIPIEGCTLKMNVALRELPNFTARPGTDEPHHRGQVNTPLTAREWADTYLAARAGRLPERLWTELYFHTAYDETVAPQGVHTMSVFAQHVPNAFAPDQGTWDSRREDVGDLALAALARHCTNIPEAILLRESLGPPDVEREVGLTGGHIFQGEMLPAFMWSNRLGPQSPMPGFYLCGAATYPGGSVMAVNGRNAALAILKSTR